MKLHGERYPEYLLKDEEKTQQFCSVYHILLKYLCSLDRFSILFLSGIR